MPLLDRTGLRVDRWTAVVGADIANISHVMVQLADLPAAITSRQPGQLLGIAVDNTLARDQLRPLINDVALIAIRFPAFSDGRGFSLAKALRGFGFTGTLRAVGPLIPDQFTYALDCGFDEIDLPVEHSNRQPLSQWLAAAKQFSGTYQRGYGPKSILDQRRAARSGATS